MIRLILKLKLCTINEMTERIIFLNEIRKNAMEQSLAIDH